MNDIHSNYLIRKTVGNLAPSSIKKHMPMEILGSHISEKYGIFLAPLSLFCTIFNHLNWETYDLITKERHEESTKNNSNICNDEVLE